MKNEIQLYMLAAREKCQYVITPCTSPAPLLWRVQLLQIGSEPGKHIRGIHMPLCKYAYTVHINDPGFLILSGKKKLKALI